jgi:hypothetical protein
MIGHAPHRGSQADKPALPRLELQARAADDHGDGHPHAAAMPHGKLHAADGHIAAKRLDAGVCPFDAQQCMPRHHPVIAQHDVGFRIQADEIFVVLQRHPDAVMQSAGNLKLRQDRLRSQLILRPTHSVSSHSALAGSHRSRT